MPLLVISLYELEQFLQIIMWIAIPATLITIIVTTILHYRGKKQIQIAGPSPSGEAQPTGEPGVASSNESYQNILDLQKKYITEIESNHQDHFQLKEDFKKLEKKYIELIAKNGTQVRSNFSSPVFQDAFQQKENELLQLKASLLQLEEMLRSEKEQKKAHSAEMNKLGNLLKDMEMVATKARQETEDQIQAFGQQLEETKNKEASEKKGWLADMEKLNHDLSLQKEENARLRNKLIEQDSAHDVIEEKNNQIGFLQNQLDNRIKNYHQLEYQNREDETRLNDLLSLTARLEKESAGLKEELELRNAERTEILQKATALEERMNLALEEQSALVQTLQTKTSYIEYVEHALTELGESHSQSLGHLNNSQIDILQLQQELMKESQKSSDLENKLEFSNQLLKKIYLELGKAMSPAIDPDPQEEIRLSANGSNERAFAEPVSLEFDMVADGSMQMQD
jgi:hypothetical protein